MAHVISTLCQMYYDSKVNDDGAGCVEGAGDKKCKQFL